MVKEVFSFGASPDAIAIRNAVYVDELGLESDIDEYDRSCWEVVLYLDKIPISTGRVREIDPENFLIEKVTVIKSLRGQSVGAYTHKFLITKIRTLGGRYAIVHVSPKYIEHYKALQFRLNKGELRYEKLDGEQIEMVRSLVKKYP